MRMKPLFVRLKSWAELDAFGLIQVHRALRALITDSTKREWTTYRMSNSRLRTLQCPTVNALWNS